ncbi:hypothetical protein [Christiangramia sp.]|uniref:hypothetical protein n=1 Tax=Christiangramia sp. TaxID=1931228 RepID=UPI00262CDCAD|nr:hypothetical protein [Christiangramia sp.]
MEWYWIVLIVTGAMLLGGYLIISWYFSGILDVIIPRKNNINNKKLETMSKNTIVIIAFLIFLAAGIAVISFFGLGFMTFEGGYSTWKIIGTILTFLIAAGLAYYLYRKVRL